MRKTGWIRRDRESRGLSQANLARLLNISQPVLSQWETGKAVPSEREEQAIRRTFAEFDQQLARGKLPSAIRPRSRRRILATSNGQPYDPASERSNDSGYRDESAEARKARFTRFAASYSRAQNELVGISLFAGCGGMSLGFKRAGFRVPGFVEIDPGARLTYELNFPKSVCLGHDVRGISEDDVSEWSKLFGVVDVVFGGPPCQGFSLTGKRNRFDPRNELYSHFARIASILQARSIILENVRLLTSMKSPDGSMVLDRITDAFEEAGYSCDFKVLNAQDYGVPQCRERVFVVGTRENQGLSFPEPTHGNCAEKMLFGTTLDPYVTFRDACGDLEPLESGERSRTDPLHFAVDHPRHVIEWLKNVPEGQSAHNNPDPRLRPPCGYNTTYKRIRWDEPCSTINTTFGMISGCRNVHPTNTRSLTIREAARCQTFPDDFQFRGTLGQIRTVIGNAVPPLLAKVLASHLVRTILKPTTSRAKREMAVC